MKIDTEKILVLDGFFERFKKKSNKREEKLELEKYGYKK